MALVNTESGRVYLLELGKVILEQMAPKIMDGLSPSMMARLQKIAKNRNEEDIATVSDGTVMEELGMSPEEWGDFTENVASVDEIGPDVLVVCMRHVDGIPPAEIIDPVTDKPYGSTEAFIDKDEDFVDDLPELMDVVSKKLGKYYGGLLSQGELRSSFRSRTKKN